MNIISDDDMKQNFSAETEQLNFHYNRIKTELIRPSYSILQVWNNPSEEFPTLSILARAMCVLPVSTVDLERTFSRLKEVDSPKRNRLTVENIEARLLCLQYFGKDIIAAEPEIIFQLLDDDSDEDEEASGNDKKNGGEKAKDSESGKEKGAEKEGEQVGEKRRNGGKESESERKKERLEEEESKNKDEEKENKHRKLYQVLEGSDRSFEPKHNNGHKTTPKEAIDRVLKMAKLGEKFNISDQSKIKMSLK